MAGCTSCSSEVQLEDTFCPRCGAPVVDPLIGVVVGDRYRIVSRIGVGGMGAVYRAEHTMMRRDLAIKVLLPELGGKEEFARRFEREAESASRLAHPNIISVTDFGRTADGSLFLAMEFLAGESLSSIIKAGPLPRARALSVVRQILRGLEHAHGAGIVHRDLKPDNIMLVERDGVADVVKILDFGIAKVTEPLSGGGAGGTALTQAGMIFGTPEYLSPEQALAEIVDPRADIYAAGVILYEMLAGRKPFVSEDKVKLISMHLAHAPPRLREANPDVEVPVALEQVVLQALEKSRENRFATAVAFLQALEDAEALADLPDPGATMVQGRPGAGQGVVDAVGRFLSGGRGLALALAVVAAVSVGAYVRGARHRALVATPARPAPAAPALADRLKRVEAALEDGNTTTARLALDHELSERPRDGRVRYMLGRVAFAEGKHGEAMSHYREAIGLDAGFRGDPVLLGHVETALGESRNADAALDLAVERIGAPAADLLQKVANESGDLSRRQRAVAALEEMGKSDKVDRVSLGMLQLKKAHGCEEKKVFVEKLRDLGDPRALPALRDVRGRSIGGLFRLGGSNTRCMKKELPAAIKELEGKVSETSEESDSDADSEQPSLLREDVAMKLKAVKHDPRNLLTSLVLVFPLFLIYQVGVLFTLPMLNGADFLTVFLFHNLGLTTSAYLGYTALVAAAFVAGVIVLRKRQHFDAGLVWRVFLESAIYALTMGSLIVFVMTRVFGVSPRLAGGVAAQSFGTRLVMSLGAGVYEETVFRLGLLAGLTALFERGIGVRRSIAGLLGLAISSLLFSAMHHIPPYGDPFAIGVFTFRVLAGACFGLLFWFRGFAVAVYTHALYDLYVLLVR